MDDTLFIVLLGWTREHVQRSTVQHEHYYTAPHGVYNMLGRPEGPARTDTTVDRGAHDSSEHAGARRYTLYTPPQDK